MIRKSIISIIILILFIITSCTTTSTQADERWMVVENYTGVAEIKEENSDNWYPVENGEKVPPGSSLRTLEDSNLLIITDDGSAFAMGFNTVITLDNFKENEENSTITINMEEGGILIAASELTVENESLKIKTPDLEVLLTNVEKVQKIDGLAFPIKRLGGYAGSMVVRIEKGVTPEEAATKVGVMQGNGTITFPNGNTKTISDIEKGIIYNRYSEEITVYSASLLEEAREMGIADLDLFFFFTPTPEPSRSATKTQMTLTPIITWTPFPDFGTATITPTQQPLPTHRATPSSAIGVDGLTAEESANAGSHVYEGYGVAYGDCTFSGAEAENIGSLTFSRDNVTLKAKGGSGSISYPKVQPNVYRITQNEISATLTFYIDGWDMEVQKGGQPCSFQTFIIQ